MLPGQKAALAFAIFLGALISAAVIYNLFRMLVDYYVAKKSRELIIELHNTMDKLRVATADANLQKNKYKDALNTAGRMHTELNKFRVRCQQLEFQLRNAHVANGGYTNNNPPPQKKQFSDEEINRLVRLCHPDRHGNSKASVEMTQKLMSMRS